MRTMTLTIALALIALLSWQLTASRRLVDAQQALIQRQCQVITTQQQSLTQALQAQDVLLNVRRPIRVAQK